MKYSSLNVHARIFVVLPVKSRRNEKFFFGRETDRKNTGEKKKTLRLKRLRGCDNRRTKIRNTIVAASGGIPTGL
jgi:hypothetical protein